MSVMYSLKCEHFGIECDHVIRGKTKVEVLFLAVAHMWEEHGMNINTDSLDDLRNTIEQQLSSKQQ